MYQRVSCHVPVMRGKRRNRVIELETCIILILDIVTFPARCTIPTRNDDIPFLPDPMTSANQVTNSRTWTKSTFLGVCSEQTPQLTRWSQGCESLRGGSYG